MLIRECPVRISLRQKNLECNLADNLADYEIDSDSKSIKCRRICYQKSEKISWALLHRRQQNRSAGDLLWRTLVFLALFCAMIGNSLAMKSSMTYVPHGTNTLLYTPGQEPIMLLDQLTFVDTVFEHGRPQAFVVEFYADWCGHCRAFAPFFRELAAHVYNWRPVVQISAINCADNFNGQVCRANGINHFPIMKYFPRSATNFNDAMDLLPVHSVENMMDQIAAKVTNEDMLYSYPDWPNLNFIEIDRNTRFVDLWAGAHSTNFLLLVFEQFEHSSSATHGFRLFFELLPYQHLVVVRRVLSTSPLAAMLRLTVFPNVALFRRNDETSIFMETIHPGTSQNVLNRIYPDQMATIATTPPTYVPRTTAAPVFDCDADATKCKPLYFTSESDMLKAMHMALLDEVARPNGLIRGENFTHLYNFVALLADHFPKITLTVEDNSRMRRNNHASLNANYEYGYRIRLRRSIDEVNKETMQSLPRISRQTKSADAQSSILTKSERARSVFAHLKSALDNKKKDGHISANEWRHQFTSIERIYENPFPTNATWQHCRGTTPEFRGYTCALWTTFHALTVHTYLNNLKDQKKTNLENPMRSLKAIQGWVDSFFGCEHCRNHFMEMTTRMFPMNETWIQHPRDAMLYLWRAHNIVNKRLRGQSTEDPQFLKHQFPPAFLCPLCNTGGGFSRRNVRQFLVNYYTNIRPASN